MGDAETVVLGLTDQVSGPASAMGAAIDRLGAQVSATQSKLDALRDAGSPIAVKVDTAGLDDAARAAERLAASTSSAAPSVDGLASAASGGAVAAAGAKVPFEALAGATTILGGAAGGTAAKGINLVKFIGQLPPVALAAVVAFAALAIAVVAVGAAVSAAFSAASSAREELLALTGAMRGNAAAGEALQATISSVSASTALGRDKVTEYALALSEAKLSGAELKAALEAAAVAGSAGGDKVAAAFLKDVAAAKAAGQSVDALAAKMKAQLGGVAAKQALALDVQLSKARENIASMFAKANIEPFLVALSNSLDLLSENTVIGQQLRDVMGKAFDGLFAAAARVMPYVKEGLVGVAIVGVSTYIAIKRVSNAIDEMIGPADAAGASTTGLAVALELGKAAAIAIVAAVGAVIAIVGVFYGMYLAIGAAGTWVGQQLVAGFNYLHNLSLADIATGLIDGLVSGIEAGAARVIAVVSNLGSSAVAAMKAAIGMASPAKAFINVGEMGIGEGVAVGVERAGDRVDTSLEELADPASIKAEVKSAARSPDARAILYIENLSIGSREDLGAFRAMLASEFEIMTLDGSPA